MFWDKVDAILVLNLDRSTERWQKIRENLSKTVPVEKIHRISAVLGVDLPGFDQKPWFTKRTGERKMLLAGASGCTLSHARALDFALEQGWETIIVLEDDVELTEDLNTSESGKLLDHFLETNKDWDLFYLGHLSTISPLGKEEENADGSKICRIPGTLSSYALMLSRKGILEIQKSLPNAANIWSWMAKYKAIDAWLKTWFTPCHHVYSIYPEVFFHLDGFSEIGQHHSDYQKTNIKSKPTLMEANDFDAYLAKKWRKKHFSLIIGSTLRWIRMRLSGFSNFKCKD